MISRFQFGGAGSDRGFWAVIGLLLLAVLLPTAGLLYFINEAVGSQRDLVRRKLGDAYRGQLRLVSERIDSFWEQRARDLDARSDSESPAVFFEHCVRDGLADSVICLNRDGSPAYPALAAPPRPDPTAARPQWIEARRLEDSGKPAPAAAVYSRLAAAETDPAIAARAAQGYIRCLAAGGQVAAALNAIDENFDWHLAYANGLDGRLIAADQFLLYTQLAGFNQSGRQAALRRLSALLKNYTSQVPSAQRLFLMDQVRALIPNGELRTFPTYQAERLAERLLSDGRATPGDSALRLSGLGDVWKLTSPSGRTIAFYGTSTILNTMAKFLESPDASHAPAFRLTQPAGKLPQHQQWMSAGTRLPDWLISMNPAGQGLSEELASRQIASYLWIGLLTVATAIVLALAGGQVLQRQMRIAHLKTDLVAAVSHELKTPLASMKLLVESLLSGEQFEPGRTRQYLQLVARENSRLSRLIDNFLTFSRMERNRGKFDLARVRPEAVAAAAIESIGDRFPVDLHVDAGLPSLYADPDALVTVLLNLLDNAYKYTGDHRRIELQVSSAAGRVRFAVKDNGIGISEREQKRIFRRFYQVDRRLARQTGGVGLGLSIVEFIVKAHHGEIAVESRPGAGSTFTVSLPPSTSVQEAAA